MRLRFIWPGKTRNPQLRALCDEYLQRLEHFARCEVSEVRESGTDDPRVGIETDSRRISDALRNGSVTVLLDREGTPRSSEKVAAQIQEWANGGIREVAFIIGGPHGVSGDLREAVDARWSLSQMTFTHEMARVLLLEQLYRAYAINHRLPYQK